MIAHFLIEQIAATRRDDVFDLRRLDGVAHPEVEQGVTLGAGFERCVGALRGTAAHVEVRMPGVHAVVKTTAKTQRRHARQIVAVAETSTHIVSEQACIELTPARVTQQSIAQLRLGAVEHRVGLRVIQQQKTAARRDRQTVFVETIGETIAVAIDTALEDEILHDVDE